MVSWGTSLDSRAAKEKTAHHKSRYHTFRSISNDIYFFGGFLYLFPTLKHQRHCSALVLGPDPSSRNVQIWQRKRPDWSKAPPLDVGSQVTEDSQSSPWLNDLDHFSGQNWKPPLYLLYDFPIFRTVPIKIATVKVPSHNEYSTPGTSKYLEAPPKVTAQ